MSVNGKRDGFDVGDFVVCGRNAALRRGRATEILRQVQDTVSRWPEFAAQAGVPEATTGRIGSTQRTAILP